MLRSRIPLIVTITSLCLSYGVTARSEDVRDAIESGNRAFTAAFLRGDAQAVAELYTSDAQVLPPGAGTVAGRTAIAAFWKGAIDAGVKDLVLVTEQVESEGDLAYETGRVRLVSSHGRVTEDRYLVVWKRGDGGWRLHRDIWNSPGGE